MSARNSSQNAATRCPSGSSSQPLAAESTALRQLHVGSVSPVTSAERVVKEPEKQKSVTEMLTKLVERCMARMDAIEEQMPSCSSKPDDAIMYLPADRNDAEDFYNGDNYELDQRTSDKVPLMIVEGTIKGKKVECLLDGGSQYTIMGTDMMERLGIKYKKIFCKVLARSATRRCIITGMQGLS